MTSNDKLAAGERDTRCGFVALVGAPNAGKSTLLNALVGTKVSIVTHKAQTTRSQIRGVVTTEKNQIIFVDTPGIFQPKRRLDRAMVQSAWSGVGDADMVALIVDAKRGMVEEVEKLIEGLKSYKQPIVLVLNKIDLIERSKLLALAQTLNEHIKFGQTFMLSAKNGDGVKAFVDHCGDNMPLDHWHFPEDHLTDLTMALTAAEVTREKLFLRIHEEIPYGATVETESFKTQKDGSYRIQQIIYVSRDGHKKIILGKNGKAIKVIGAESRKELCEMFDTKVHLFLFVKVREKWGDDPSRYKEMGLEFPK